MVSLKFGVALINLLQYYALQCRSWFLFFSLFLLKWHIEPGSLIPLEKNELLIRVHFTDGGTGQRQVTVITEIQEQHTVCYSFILFWIPSLTQPVNHETYAIEPLGSYASVQIGV